MNNLNNVIKTLMFVVLMGGTTMVLIPVYLLSSFDSNANNAISFLRYFGFVPLLLGIIMIFWCIRDFILRGKGTPAPFAPPKHLVITGLFQFMRNPIITGGIFVLIGEGLLMESIAIGFWALIFFIVNHIWLIFWEEPNLIQRFGEEYKIYMENVPRWIPKFSERKMNRTENK